MRVSWYEPTSSEKLCYPRIYWSMVYRSSFLRTSIMSVLRSHHEKGVDGRQERKWYLFYSHDSVVSPAVRSCTLNELYPIRVFRAPSIRPPQGGHSGSFGNAQIPRCLEWSLFVSLLLVQAPLVFPGPCFICSMHPQLTR